MEREPTMPGLVVAGPPEELGQIVVREWYH